MSDLTDRAYWQGVDAACHRFLAQQRAYLRYQRRIRNHAGLTLVLEAETLVSELARTPHQRHAEYGTRRFD